MAPQVSDEQLGHAVLESVEHGSFPQSEDVASAEVSSAALPKLLEVMSAAREKTKVCFSTKNLEGKEGKRRKREREVLIQVLQYRMKYGKYPAKHQRTWMAGSRKRADCKTTSRARKKQRRRL
jgi:hypothetical protein